MQMLRRYLGAGCVLAALALGATDAEKGVPFVRTEWIGSLPGARARTVPKTLVYAERQPYGPLYNYLHWFDDRPLYMDVSLRDRTDIGGSYAAFFHDITIAQRYGLDGFGAISNFSMHKRQLELLAQNPVPGYSHLIVFCGDFGDAQYPVIKDMILAAAKSPFTARYDGKLLMWCYGGGTERQMNWVRKLRADAEIPPFLFIGDVPFYDMYLAHNKYSRSNPPKPVPAAEVEAYRKKVADALAVFDGFQMWTVDRSSHHMGEYGSRFVPTDIYRKYELPVVKEVLSRPENKGKLIGDYLQTCYINPDSGAVDGAYGTEALRLFLDELVALNPDILMLFEWNEEYENTHFQPTVAHGRTYERIVNYYRSLLDGTKPVPRPGDDPSIPNLIVSTRRAIQLGDPWHCELLYVPDGSPVSEVKATVILKDNRGRVIRRFPTETIPTDRLKAIDYRISSELLADCASTVVVLETEYGGKRQTWTGFDSTRIRPTTTTGGDFLYTDCPLHELLQPTKREFTVKETDEEGVYEVEGLFACGEKLNSLEILDDVEEIAAADVENRFDRSRFDLFRGVFTTSSAWKLGREKGGTVHAGTARVAGASGARLERGNQPWEAFGVNGRNGDVWEISNNFGERAWGTFFVAVPKDETKRAKLIFDFPKLGHFEKDLATVLEIGRYAEEFVPQVRLELERLDELADIPRNLNLSSARVASRLKSPNRFPSYQLRAISASGKIWRSPLRHPRIAEDAKTQIEVIAAMTKDLRRVEVAAEAIPDLQYVFDPKFGAWLMSGGDARFDISLGGAGRDGGSMITYSSNKDRFASDYVRGDPQWERLADGSWALRFARGSYLNFPQETIPHTSPFTIAFSIQPDSSADQVLLRTRRVNDEDCGLQAVIVGGELRVSYFGVHISPLHFDTKLRIVPGVWNEISIAKDFRKITATVNGESKSIAYDRRAYYLQAVNFGGNVAPGPGVPSGVKPFEGLLRSLRISHR